MAWQKSAAVCSKNELGTPLEVELSHSTFGGGSYHRVSAGVLKGVRGYGWYLATNTLETGSDHG